MDTGILKALIPQLLVCFLLSHFTTVQSAKIEAYKCIKDEKGVCNFSKGIHKEGHGCHVDAYWMCSMKNEPICGRCCQDYYWDFSNMMCMKCGPHFTTPGSGVYPSCSVPKSALIPVINSTKKIFEPRPPTSQPTTTFAAAPTTTKLYPTGKESESSSVNLRRLKEFSFRDITVKVSGNNVAIAWKTSLNDFTLAYKLEYWKFSDLSTVKLLETTKNLIHFTVPEGKYEVCLRAYIDGNFVLESQIYKIDAVLDAGKSRGEAVSHSYSFILMLVVLCSLGIGIMQ